MQVSKISTRPMGLSVSMFVCVCIVSTGHTLAKIKNVKKKFSFVDFDICHRKM